MKDIETRLKSARPQLRGIDVADKVAQRLGGKRPALKPVQAFGLVLLMIAGFAPLGTSLTHALAIGVWDEYAIVSQQNDKTVILPNGNHVIAIDASWCGTYGVEHSFDQAKQEKASQREYFEVKRNSGVSDQDVINWRKTNCEASLVSNSLKDLAKSMSIPEGSLLVSAGLVLGSFETGKTNLRVTSELHFTFDQPIDEVKLLNIPSGQLAASDMHKGDYVRAFVVVDKAAGVGVEGCKAPFTDIDRCNLLKLAPQTNPGRLVALVRIPAYSSSVGSPVDIGKNVFTALPCRQSMNGLCSSGGMDEKGHYLNLQPLVPYPIAESSLAAVTVLLIGAAFVWRKYQSKR